jgi:hypothetical protein
MEEGYKLHLDKTKLRNKIIYSLLQLLPKQISVLQKRKIDLHQEIICPIIIKETQLKEYIRPKIQMESIIKKILHHMVKINNFP